METIENYLLSLVNDRDKMVAAIGLPNIPNNVTFTELLPHLENMGKVHRVSTVNEMHELPNPKQEDICIVTTEHLEVLESGDSLGTIVFPEEIEIDFTPETLPSVSNGIFVGLKTNRSSISISGSQISIRLNYRDRTLINKTIVYHINSDGTAYEKYSGDSQHAFPSNATIDYSSVSDERVLEILHRLFVRETGIFNGIYIYNYGWEHYDVQCHVPADKLFSGYKAYTTHGVVNGTFTFDGKEGLLPTEIAIGRLLEAGRSDLSYAFANYPYTNTYLLRLMPNYAQYPVTNIAYMYSNCKSLVNPGLDGFDTSNVTNMAGVFYCSPRVNLKALENWNTSNVTDLSNAFLGVNYSTAVLPNFANWDVSKVTNLCNTFSRINSNIIGLENWNTSNVTDMSYMFIYTNNTNYVPNISNWNVSNVTNMSHIFYYINIYGTNLDLSRWNTTNVTDLSGAFCFYNASSNTILNVGGWDTSNVVNLHDIFGEYHSTSTSEINLTRWNVSNVKDMTSFFPSTTYINITGWDTSNVTNMSQLFVLANQSVYTSVRMNTIVNQLNTHNVIDLSRVFRSSTSYNSWVGLDVSHLNTINVKTAYTLFDTIVGLTTINGLNTLDFSNLENASRMFNQLNSINKIELGGSLSNVTNMYAMFYNCYNLSNLVLNWNTLTNVSDVTQVFFQCNNLSLSVINNFCNALCNMNVPEAKRILSNANSLSPFYNTNINILSIGVPQATINNLINNGWSFES